MSSSLTGPLTFRMMDREVSSRNSTRTWVTPPRDPVRPRTLMTRASLTGTLEEAASYGSEERRSGQGGRRPAGECVKARRGRAARGEDEAGPSGATRWGNEEEKGRILSAQAF